MAWSAWYPTSDPISLSRQPPTQFFELGRVVFDGHLARDRRFPVVLLSHGTGGSPESLGWLARGLAAQGCIVIGAHHHGNTGREAYRAEGFLCWWERVLDLSALLSILEKAGPFAGQIDMTRVYALGFSLGAYSALALAGARTSMQRFQSWVAASGGGFPEPKEFPGLAAELDPLMSTSEPFRTSWARQNQDFRDDRICAVVAIAAPPPVRAFTETSLRAMDIPVLLITGEADQEAPSTVGADWLVQTNAAFQRLSVGADVGHYTFLGFPTGPINHDSAFLFDDRPQVDRTTVHNAVLRGVAQAFAL